MMTPTAHSERGKRVIASFFIVLMFFGYAVQAMHYHSKNDPVSNTEYSFVQYSPQCLLCHQLHHQHHDGLIPVLLSEIHIPPFDAYPGQFFYLQAKRNLVLFALSNKDPPSSFTFLEG